MAHYSESSLKAPKEFNFACDVIDFWAAKSPKLQAMYWVSQDYSRSRRLDYTYFQRQSHRIAVLLKILGVKPGQVILMIMPRVPIWWEIAIGALRSGIVISPATTLLVDKDIEYRCRETRASVFVGDSNSVERFLRVRSKCPHVEHVLQFDESNQTCTPSAIDLKAALEAIPQDALFEGYKTLSRDPSIIFFTSGTTGPPKMVLHNHISYPLAPHTITGKYWLQLSPGKLYWNLSEQGWAKAAWSLFGTWNCGASLFIHDDRQPFDPIRLLNTLHRYPITTLCAPPTAYRQLVLRECQDYLASKPPQALSHCTGAGEPLNDSVIRTWQDMTGLQICDGYGQTETIMVCGNFSWCDIRPGSMGKPSPGVPLKIIGPQGGECEAGKEGDIAVLVDNDSGPGGFFGLFDGYLGGDGSLNRKISKLGGKSWYLTGDRALRDEDGYFWFVGRADDVINSAGYRIGPFEVESTLKLHPGVVESAVIPSPDFSRGEVVKGFVVLTSDYTLKAKKDPDSVRKELQNFCKEHAAPYKYPRKLDFVDASFLPKTISGKIKRSELKAMEWKKANMPKL